MCKIQLLADICEYIDIYIKNSKIFLEWSARRGWVYIISGFSCIWFENVRFSFNLSWLHFEWKTSQSAESFKHIYSWSSLHRFWVYCPSRSSSGSVYVIYNFVFCGGAILLEIFECIQSKYWNHTITTRRQNSHIYNCFSMFFFCSFSFVLI